MNIYDMKHEILIGENDGILLLMAYFENSLISNYLGGISSPTKQHACAPWLDPFRSTFWQKNRQLSVMKVKTSSWLKSNSTKQTENECICYKHTNWKILLGNTMVFVRTMLILFSGAMCIITPDKNIWGCFQSQESLQTFLEFPTSTLDLQAIHVMLGIQLFPFLPSSWFFRVRMAVSPIESFPFR